MTFTVKLVGLTLVTVLSILSFIAVLAGKATESDYPSGVLILAGKTIDFSPNRHSSYDIRGAALAFDSSLGRKLDLGPSGRQRVELEFDFPFFRGFFRSLHVLNGPMVFLGDRVSEDGWGGYNPQPAIAPLIMNLDSGRGGGVFFKSETQAATVTWYRLPEPGYSSPNTVQLVLRQDGTFSMSFKELAPQRSFEAEQLYDYTVANTRGGDQAPGGKPVAFAPRLSGIHPGGSSMPLQPVSFDRDLPLSSLRPAIIFESYEMGYYKHLHSRMAVLAVLMAASSAFILFLFPALFRANLIRPLRTLSEGMRRAEEGDLGVSVSAQFNDEVGFLTRSFNRMLESINRVQASFRILAEDAEDGILILSGDALVYANRHAAEMTAYKVQELAGIRFDDLIHSASVPPVDVHKEEPSEALLVTKSGTEIPVELTFSRTLWQGKPADVVLIRDVTARKRSEEAARLQQQRLMSTDKLTSLGVMAAGMAHEINTPNQLILSYASLLSRAAPQILPLLDPLVSENRWSLIAGMDIADFRDRYSDMLSSILKSATRIDAIIKNLKDFSRDASGQAMSALDPNRVIASAVELVAGYLKRATGNFRLELENALPRVKGNAVRLEQVMTNLLLNSCQALAGRDCAITVRSFSGEGRRSVRIEVHDEGVGIPPQDLARMGEAFFTTKKASGGPGLGLYVSRAIVEEHYGSLCFYSEPGRGTSAVVTLPAGVEEGL